MDELLLRYLHRQTTPAEDRRVEAWAGDSPENRRVLAGLERVVAAAPVLDAAAEPGPPPRVEEVVWRTEARRTQSTADGGVGAGRRPGPARLRLSLRGGATIVAAAVAVGLALHNALVFAQGIRVLKEDLCTTCTIELTPDAVLGTDGESVIGIALDIQRLSDGRIAMAFDYPVPHEFTVFAADGSEFRRVGRAGEGPGEYAHVWFVREHGGELQVFDRRRRRMTVLDRDFSVLRTMPVGCSYSCDGRDMAVFPDGSLAMNFDVPRGGYSQYRTIEEFRAAQSWFVVHILGEDGQIRFSMDETRRNERGTPFRHLEIAPNGSLLSAHQLEYRIDRWDPATGERLETFVRDAAWWPEDNSNRAPRPDMPPVTSVGDMQVDEAGRVWLYINRPAPDWRDHLERTEPNPEWPAGGYRYGPGASESVIEVVDTESGRVLVSQVVDLPPAPRTRFFAPGWLAVYDEEGIPQYRMWRVRLEGLE